MSVLLTFLHLTLTINLKMDFHWNDGGRASSGFIGLAGDCVTRSIAIAAGISYRDVYNALGEASNKTARNGVYTSIAEDYLAKLGWDRVEGGQQPFVAHSLPKGVVITHLVNPESPRSGHFCTVVDHVVHDTWNPCDEDEYVIQSYWTSRVESAGAANSSQSSGPAVESEQTLTQGEFDRILHRLRSLDNTASNHASTEGEKRNALRMMQALMLRHNLSRKDITEDDNVEGICYARIACPVNGRRACSWEKSLAAYLTKEIFPMTQWYYGSKGNRTWFWYYGPVEDVKNCISLFQEMLLTIATAAHLQYGGHTRGSGASYAEGYVRGLPRRESPDPTSEQLVSETSLIHQRTLAVHDAARAWLRLECGISLVSTRGAGRDQHDPSAASRGQKHGAKHDLSKAGSQKRITSSS